jgi:hypothetical protein
MSGALVFKLVIYNMENFSGVQREFLFKVSKDRQRLQQELKQIPPIGVFSVGTSPSCAIQDVVEANGWYAIAYEFIGEALTLQEWLTKRSPSQEEVASFLAELFRDLKNLYRDHKFKGGAIASRELFLAETSTARSLMTIEELWPLIQRYGEREGQKLDRAVIEGFITHQATKEWIINNGTSEMLMCTSHGDLHSRNILVGLPHVKPHLIDFADRGERLWASDIAQLCASLLIQGWDHGVYSWEFERLRNWRQVLENWLFSTAITPLTEGTNASVWYALVWLRDNVKSIWREIINYEVPLSEFHLALTMKLIELAIMIEIPAPKRAFALLAAHDILVSLKGSKLKDVHQQ